MGFIFFMKKVAILVDGEFFSRAVKKAIGYSGRPTAKQIHANALALAAPDEEVFRIFFYDSRPFTGSHNHPLSGTRIDYSKTGAAQARQRFLAELGQMDLVALRCGATKPRGWQLTDTYLKALKAGSIVVPTEADYELRFEQKGVDMRIGIDVATLSLNRYVERIVVASNDTDLIPAFKVARRHGVQVVIAQVGAIKPHKELVEDSDFRRPVTPVR